MNGLKVLIRPNFKRQNTASVLHEAIEKLKAFGAVPMLGQADLQVCGMDCITGDSEQLLHDCDVLMTVGGDGTVLNAAPDAIRADKPLIGINSGHIGFLTQLELSELNLLERLARREYKVQGRMLIEAVVVSDHGEKRSYIALNDIVMRCEDANRILTFSVSAGGRQILRQRADGVIFATPTGSTAYSLSAGGPVVSPDLSAMVLTPICPHGTFRCSLVLPPDAVYTVAEEGERTPGFKLATDGTHHGCYYKAQIMRSQREIKLIDLQYRDFYQNLNIKLIGS